MRAFIHCFLLCMLLVSCNQSTQVITEETSNKEQLRPMYHFTPTSGWMNDPNGLVYNDGTYHLFYQYYPHATVWGPMHWGHATSEDMVNWEEQPIALYPDEKGLIFSGSAVVDAHNTSGFGEGNTVPLVAFFTYHNMLGEKTGASNFQTQGLAYSLDKGTTWTKFAGNPVIGNDGIRDLRDPKVFWHEPTKSWIMVLVAGNYAKLYRSKNLKEWENISDFGEGRGSQNGVWECPDLFKLPVQGTDEEKWVLLISVGGGAPNGGSGTQYFVGEFDGTTFTSEQEDHAWLDWGTDNYAGVTYNNTPDGERIFIGWMSNWQYALKTPATSWRSAMTLPRELSLKKIGSRYSLYNSPVETLNTIVSKGETNSLEIEAKEEYILDEENLNTSKITFAVPKSDFKLSLMNDEGEKLVMLLDAASELLMLDRTHSGVTSFHYEFGNKLHYAAMQDLPEELNFTIYMDHSSVEVFLNDGQYAMTDLLFPTVPFNRLVLENLSNNSLTVKDLGVHPVKMKVATLN